MNCEEHRLKIDINYATNRNCVLEFGVKVKIDAAMDLGASGFQRLIKIWLPLSLTGICPRHLTRATNTPFPTAGEP